MEEALKFKDYLLDKVSIFADTGPFTEESLNKLIEIAYLEGYIDNCIGEGIIGQIERLEELTK